MHTEEHLDLIDALVEGHSTDPAAARRLVEACPECGDAYRAHMAVKQAVESESVVPLSQLERRRLHSSVWSELEVATRPKRTTPLWYRIAPIAAALVLVVGVGSILLNRGGSMATETTVAAASAPLDAYSSPQAESSNRGLSGTGKSDAGGAAPTTISPSQDTTAMAAPATTAQATNTTAPPRRLSAEQLPQAATEFARTARPAALDPDLDQCLSQDALAPDDPFADEKVIVDDQLAWLVAFGTQGDVSAVVVYGENDCAVFFRT